ncbi:MAG TPA: hypothetical protein VN702_05490 [Acetobacteraceae bacterium]|nr:hypothetical protein [Acetobacteraceae bacterium]
MIDLSQETEALARRVAEARRISVDAAIRTALEASAASVPLEAGGLRDPSASAVTARRERIARIVREIAAMPVIDRRPLPEIVDDINTL